MLKGSVKNIPMHFLNRVMEKIVGLDILVWLDGKEDELLIGQGDLEEIRVPIGGTYIFKSNYTKGWSLIS